MEVDIHKSDPNGGLCNECGVILNGTTLVIEFKETTFGYPPQLCVSCARVLRDKMIQAMEKAYG